MKAQLAPRLAYGRHRGPARLDSRIAAVAVAIYQDSDQQWVIPLTLRPDSLQHHGGQICLPGGQVEPGESIRQAALREFEEELGVRPSVLSECGELSTQYVYGSDNLVHPIVFAIERPGVWIPDPKEVVEVITVPVAVFGDRTNDTLVRRKKNVRTESESLRPLTYSAPAIQFEGHRIWGATAMILEELAQLLHLRPASAGNCQAGRDSLRKSGN